jgi:hypothetical protein
MPRCRNEAHLNSTAAQPLPSHTGRNVADRAPFTDEQPKDQTYETSSDRRCGVCCSRLFGACLGTADHPRRQPDGYAGTQSWRAGVDALHHEPAAAGAPAIHAAYHNGTAASVYAGCKLLRNAAELSKQASRADLSRKDGNPSRPRIFVERQQCRPTESGGARPASSGKLPQPCGPGIRLTTTATATARLSNGNHRGRGTLQAIELPLM